MAKTKTTLKAKAKNSDVQASQSVEPADESTISQADSDPINWLKEHGDYMFRFAISRVRSKETAEDLVQDTLVSAYQAFDSFEGRASVRTWLISILRNKIIDHMRRGKRVQFVSLEGMSESNSSDDSFNNIGLWRKVVKSWSMDQASVLENKEFMQQLQQCIDVLPDSTRLVFSLRTIDQMSTKEICSKLEIKENNVWVALHRARSQVRKCLELNWLS